MGLLSSILRVSAGVVIVNQDLVVSSSGELIEPIVRGGASVVVVAEDLDRSRWGEALLQGASTVLPKQSSLSAITSAIRHINDHTPVMAREEREELVRTYHEGRSRRRELRLRLARLTAREGEILGHLMAGRPVAEISQACVVSEATVRTQVRAILAKLEVSSQIAAVGLAHTTDWKPPGAIATTPLPATPRRSSRGAATVPGGWCR
jgi:DNA-binding NarL/FixJ family response regulator